VPHQAPAGSLVEVLLMGASIGAGSVTGWTTQVPEFLRELGRIELTVDQERITGEGSDPPLVGHQLDRLFDPVLG
jgi:hypothetical protein